jgi:1-acyl-sn-glycerol-3-phosphate acyltransferase
MERFFERAKKESLFGFSYGVGLLLGIIFFLGCMLMVVNIQHRERLPRWEKNMIIAPNHLRFWAAFIALLLFIHEWMFRPKKWGPWSTPDATNFWKRKFWFFRLAAGRAILVPRGDKAGIQRAFLSIGKTLRAGGRFVIFGEGGRTSSSADRLTTPKGRQMRPIAKGIGLLCKSAGSSVLPIWVETVHIRQWWRCAPITVKIGRLIRPSADMSVDDITASVQAALLRLADEGED